MKNRAKKDSKQKQKRREAKPGKLFSVLAGIAVLIILCSDVFGDTEA